MQRVVLPWNMDLLVCKILNRAWKYSLLLTCNNRLNVSFEYSFGSLFSLDISFLNMASVVCFPYIFHLWCIQLFPVLEHWWTMTPHHKKHIAHYILMDPPRVLFFQILACLKWYTNYCYIAVWDNYHHCIFMSQTEP